MWWIVYWGFIGVWLLGILIEGNPREDINNVHIAYRKMWGARLSAFSCMVVTLMHVNKNLDDWHIFSTLYTLFMSVVFLSNATREFATRMKFIELFNKTYKEN